MARNPIQSFWRRHFLILESLLSLFLVCLLLLLTELGALSFEPFLKENRGAVYGAFATVLGALLGFSVTAAAIVLALHDNQRLAVLRRTHQYETLWTVFQSCIRWLGVATGACLLALVVDTDHAPIPYVYVVVLYTVLVGAFRVFRAVWVLEKIIGIMTTRPPTD